MYPSPEASLLQILYSDTAFYQDLLLNDMIANIVNELWVFKYYYTYNFLITSTAFKNLRGKLFFHEKYNNKNNLSGKITPFSESSGNLTPNSHEDNEQVKLRRMHNMNLRGPYSFIINSNALDYKLTNHIFSFAFWANSPAYKVFIEALIYIIFFILIIQNLFQIFRVRRIFESFPQEILILIDGFVGLLYGYPVTSELIQAIKPWMVAHNVTNPMVAFQIASEQKTRCGVMLMFVPEFESQCSEYEFAANNIWDLSDRFLIYQYFFYFTFLGSIFEFIYAIMLTKKITITLKMLLDLIITIANIFVQIEFFGRVMNHHAIVRDNLLVSFKYIEVLMLFFTFLMWIKFLVYLKLTATFGYIIKIFEIMIQELVFFLVIFAIIVFAFAFSCFFLFEQNESFSSLSLSLRTLLEITYGQVFLDGFTSNQTLGAIVIALFSLITIVILLNLLVALLSNTYTTINQRSTLENANILYENYLIKKPDKFCSALVALPPPFNGITLLFSPFLIFTKNQRLNKLLLLIGFSFYMIPCLIIYFFVNISIVIPLCYIKYAIFIPLNLIGKRKLIRSILFLILWLIGGLLKLYYVFFFNDLPNYFRSLFSKSPQRDKLDELSLKEIKVLLEKAKNLHESGDFVGHEKLCDSLRKELDLLNKKMTSNNSDNDSFFGIDEEPVSKKYILNKIFHGISNNSIKPQRRNTTKVKNLLKELEIEKMEVFSLVKQFEGVNGKIMLSRLISILEILKYCKKLRMNKLNAKQEEKMINNIQIVDIFAVEKVVLSLLSENMNNEELEDEVIKMSCLMKESRREFMLEELYFE